jgi:hypothetical protein
MALNDRPGVQLPGSDNEQYNYGLDYSGLADSDAGIPGMPSQLLPTDQNMGAVSMPVGVGGDTGTRGQLVATGAYHRDCSYLKYLLDECTKSPIPN